MPESCSIKSTQYYTKTQINDAINNYYGGNKIFKDNLEKYAINASLSIISKAKPYGLAIAKALQLGFKLIEITDHLDYNAAKEKSYEIMKKINQNGGRMKVVIKDCVWTSANGNSQSGHYPKIILSYSAS